MSAALASVPAPGEISQEISRALSKYGVGRRYHERRLEEYGEVGQTLREWVVGPDFKGEVFAGQGRSLFGGVAAHDTFMVLARSCYLRGVTVKVVSLSVLVQETTRDDINVDLETAQALFVTPLYRKDFKGVPLTDFQRLAVEDFLMERLDNAKAVFTISSGPLAEAKLWWSETLIARLQSTNTEVQA